MALERTWHEPVMVEDEDGDHVYVGIDRAQSYAADAIAGMNVFGGSLVVVPDRRQVGHVGTEPEFRTFGFIFKWDSKSPVTRERPPQPEPEYPQPEPEPAEPELPEPVHGEPVAVGVDPEPE